MPRQEPFGTQFISSWLDLGLQLYHRKNFNSVTRDFWLTAMPTDIHDAHQDWHQQSLVRWITSGQLSQTEAENLKTRVGSSAS